MRQNKQSMRKGRRLRNWAVSAGMHENVELERLTQIAGNSLAILASRETRRFVFAVF